MTPILVLASMPLELELLVAALADCRTQESNGWHLADGRLGESRIICCAGGIGKANAAAAATAMIERHRPCLVINTGCGGAYPGSGLSVGGLAVASDELFGDEGALTPQGWLDMRAMGLPLYSRETVSLYNSIPLSRHLTEQAMQLADSYGVRLVRGAFVTVSACSGTRERGLELTARHTAVCENMEGAAVALTALRYGIPCLEIRGISNLVEDRDRARWDLTGAVEAAQRFVLKLLEGLERPASAGEAIGQPLPEPA